MGTSTREKMMLRSVLSRGLAMTGLQAKRTLTTSPVLGEWCYRRVPTRPPQWQYNASYGLMSLVWWWIFHGCLTEPAHILPFWDNYPDGEQWTDEELGIPPDDAE